MAPSRLQLTLEYNVLPYRLPWGASQVRVALHVFYGDHEASYSSAFFNETLTLAGGIPWQYHLQLYLPYVLGTIVAALGAWVVLDATGIVPTVWAWVATGCGTRPRKGKKGAAAGEAAAAFGSAIARGGAASSKKGERAAAKRE